MFITFFKRRYFAKDDSGGGGGESAADKAAREQREAAIARGDEVDASDEEKAAAEAAKAEAEKLKKAAAGGDDEETEEEKAERETAEREAAEKLEREKRIRIPKARFDEAQRKARDREAALLKQIEDLERKNAGTKQQDDVGKLKKQIDELQDKYEDLLADGKKAEARVVRGQVTDLREQLDNIRVATGSAAARVQAIDQLRYDQALAGFESQYPELNPDNDAFDEDVVEEVSQFVADFVKAGRTRHEALARAVKATLGPPKAQSGAAAEDVAKARTEAARKKAAAAAAAQPPNTKGVGNNSDKGGKQGDGKVDVMKLSKAEFAKLDAETLSKLRGDEVE